MLFHFLFIQSSLFSLTSVHLSPPFSSSSYFLSPPSFSLFCFVSPTVLSCRPVSFRIMSCSSCPSSFLLILLCASSSCLSSCSPSLSCLSISSTAFLTAYFYSLVLTISFVPTVLPHCPSSPFLFLHSLSYLLSHFPTSTLSYFFSSIILLCFYFARFCPSLPNVPNVPHCLFLHFPHTLFPALHYIHRFAFIILRI